MLQVITAFAAAILFSLLTIPLIPIFGAAFVHWRIIQGQQDPFLLF